MTTNGETRDLIEKARAVFDPYEGEGSPMLIGWITALADALEATIAAAPDHQAEAPSFEERAMLDRVWAAFGCAWNPDGFKPTVRAQMWEQVVEMAREAAERSSRVYRENQQLAAALAARPVVAEAPSEAVQALIDAADALTPDEVHDHPFAALDKVRGLTRELRAALAARPVVVDAAAVDRLIRYVRAVVTDPKYGDDPEWVRMNLSPEHMRRTALGGDQ